MRKGLLGSLAALAAGAGTAWGQPPVDPGGPAGAPVVAPGAAPPRFAPAPAIMPPGNFGPPGDPLGLGPVGGFGPPPGPMYPMPGPYAQQSYQPAPPGGGGGDGGLGYGTAPRWWFEGEYLLWFSRGQDIRYPLLTTSAPSDAGVLGAASTTVLVGQRKLGYDAFNGFRLTAGFFGDADRRLGFQMTGFTTESQVESRKFGNLRNTSGLPVLARPFVDVAGVQSAVVLSGPGIGPARVRVSTTSQTYGLEPVGVWNLYRAEPGTRRVWSVDLLAGYRFLEFHEALNISSTTQFNGGGTTSLPSFTTGPFGTVSQTGATVASTATTTFGGVGVIGPATIDTRDTFRTINRFNGFVVGLKGEARYGLLTASSFAKIAVGNMYERVEVLGTGAVISGTGTNRSVGTAFGGVLANASNIGTYTNDRFTYIPEFGGNVGVALTGGLTGFIGVNFLYFPDVVRPGTIASPLVSSAAIPFSPNYGAAGAPRGPALRIVEEDHWLGGVNFGFMLRY